MTMLPYLKATELEDKAREASWLIDGLWGEEAVGILGGEPKCCKSFLSLDMAVAISSGQPCLGRYRVANPGSVLLYAAEDSPRIVKNRLIGVAAARGVSLAACDIQVITSERLRLDQQSDIDALNETVAALRPRLLILDPFVRLHRIDENSSSEVAVILGNLRQMQKRHKTSILVVHHAKKSGGGMRAGQALRGSSEFHAWGDSNLYMRRSASNQLSLSIEHRAAASQPGIPIALVEAGERLALEVQDAGEVVTIVKLTPAERIKQSLHGQPSPMSLSAIRDACGIRMATLCEVIKEQLEAGNVTRTDQGYRLAML
jgi:hypothetical protein